MFSADFEVRTERTSAAEWGIFTFLVWLCKRASDSRYPAERSEVALLGETP